MSDADIGVISLAIAARGTVGNWSVIEVPASKTVDAVKLLRDSLESMGLTTATSDSEQDPVRLARTIADNQEDVLILFGLTGFGPTSWAELDKLRSRLENCKPVVFVVNHLTAAELSKVAPNLVSWMSTSFYSLDPTRHLLDPAETEARLSELRAKYRMTDESVITAAELGTGDAEPHFAEWLVLLGRGDLVQR